MKTREGFVSNSSSSSFVIRKEDLTPTQIVCIKNHLLIAHGLNEHRSLDGPDEEDEFTVPRGDYATGDHNAWDIIEDDVVLRGTTGQDNFDMNQFLQEIGVSTDAVTWGSYDGDW